MDILKSHDKEEPFFLYYASQNCHLPNQVPIEYELKYSHIKNEERRKYLGQVSILDESIGNITMKLKELDLLDNTLIFFTSDNGGAVYTAGRNYPLRGLVNLNNILYYNVFFYLILSKVVSLHHLKAVNVLKHSLMHLILSLMFITECFILSIG